MAHIAVWGYLPNKKENYKFKKADSCLTKCTKFGQAHSNNERKIRLLLILEFGFPMRFLDLIWVTSSTEN